MPGPKSGVPPVWSNYYEQGVVAPGAYSYAPRVEALSGGRFLLMWIEQEDGAGSPANLNLYVRVHDSATLQPLGAPRRILLPGSWPGATVTVPDVNGMAHTGDFQTLRMPLSGTTERIIAQFSSYKVPASGTRRYQAHLVALTVSGGNAIAHFLSRLRQSGNTQTTLGELLSRDWCPRQKICL